MRLHPNIEWQIQRELNRADKEIPPAIRKSWQYLFEAWEVYKDKFHSDWYELKKSINKDGWSRATVRKYALINQPYLEVQSNYWGGPKPPESKEDISIRDMVHLDVEYPDPINDADIPDEWLELAIRELRKNLELALNLETELGGYGLNFSTPIVPEENPDNDVYGRTHGLSGSVISFSSLFERLVELDVTKARDELKAWPANDDTIFSRLRIWASGTSDLVSEPTFHSIMMGLSDGAFWSSYHQRELLLVLAKRWAKLQEQTKQDIETRIIRGRAKWDGEEDSGFEERKARLSLNRLHWLKNKGCEFSLDFDAETTKLQKLTSDWKQEYAMNAADSMEGGSYRVITKTEHSVLLDVPIGRILEKARELSGRTEDFRVEKNPFAGLSTERPERAFLALTNAYPVTFLFPTFKGFSFSF